VGFEVGVLGELVVASAGVDAPLRLRPFERRVLAAVVLDAPGSLALGRLEALVWTEPPPTSRKALQTHVARIRRATADDLLVTTEAGYCLGPDVVVDRRALEAAVTATSGPARGADLVARRALLIEVLDRWRGVPYVELPDQDEVRIAREQLLEQQRVAQERLAECRLLLGELGPAVIALERLVVEEPYRERRWWLLMLGLYRSGRRRDALVAFARARTALTEGVGLEPGEDLVLLERRLVADDPGLLAASVFDGAGDGLRLPDPRPAGTFVGRDEEREAIDVVLRAGRSGTSGLQVVEGPSGIGKTALGRAVATAASANMTVAWTSCEEAPIRPLQPFEDVVAALVRDLGVARVVSLAGDHAAALAALLPGASTGEVEVAVGMAAALRSLLAAAAAQQPLLVVIDDAQWAPPSTLRFVEDLPSAGPGIVVLVLARPGAEGRGWATPDHDRVVLAPLGREETRRVVGGVLGVEAPGADLVEVADELWRRSGGHPLLVHELTAALLGQGSLREQADGWVLDEEDGVPGSVADLVWAKVAELGATTVGVLQVAAVLGPTFDPQVLDQLVPDAAAGLREGVRAGVLVDGHGAELLAFAHALTHAAVLDAVPAGRRIEVHEAAGLALAAGPSPAPLEVARHLVAAAPLDLDRAVAAAMRAGEAASAAFAHDLAADQHRAALELLEAAHLVQTPQGCDALTALGDAERLAGDDRCRGHLEQAAALAEQLDDGDRLAEAAWSLIQLGPTTRSGATDQDAARIAARALDTVRSPELRSRVAGAASLLHSMTDDPERCRSLYELAVSEARAVGGDRLLGDVLPYAFLALGGPDDLAERVAASAELDAVAERLDDPVTRFEALHLRFSVLFVRAEEGLDAALAEMEALSDRIVDPGRRWSLGYQRSALALLRGDPEASERIAEQALAAAVGVFQARALAAYGVQVLAVRAAQGRLPEMAPLIDQVLAEQPGLAAWHAARAWVAASAGDDDRARQEVDLLALDDFSSLPRDFTWTASMHSVVMATALIGDAERAAAAVRALAPSSGRFTWAGTSSFGPVDQALAEGCAAAGDRAAADHHAAIAAELSRQVRGPLHLLAAERVLSRTAA